VGRLMPICAPVIGALLFNLSLMTLMPKRNSFTRLLANTCVSVMLPKRPCSGTARGKFKLLDAAGPPFEFERNRRKGFKGIRVGPEKAFRQMILAGSEFAVPVRGELVVGEPAGAGENQRSCIQHRTVRGAGKPGSARDAGKQEAAVAVAELIALHIQQRQRDRINLRCCRSGTVCAIEESVEQRGLVALRGSMGMLGLLMNVPADAPLRCRVP